MIVDCSPVELLTATGAAAGATTFLTRPCCSSRACSPSIPSQVKANGAGPKASAARVNKSPQINIDNKRQTGFPSRLRAAVRAGGYARFQSEGRKVPDKGPEACCQVQDQTRRKLCKGQGLGEFTVVALLSSSPGQNIKDLANKEGCSPARFHLLPAG